jgi:hypothetical protein
MAQDVRSKVILGIDVNEFRRGISQVDASIKRISGQFQNLGGLIGASFAVSRIQQFASEAIDLGLKAEGISATFNKLNDPMALAELRMAVRGTVSDLELMRRANQAASVNIGMDTLATTLKYVRGYARSTGEDFDKLFGDATQELIRQTGLRLDQIGIDIVEVRKKEKELGDYTEAVLAIMSEKMGNFGEETLSAADKVDQQRASIENLKTEIGTGLLPAYQLMLEAVSGFLNAFKVEFSTVLTFWEKLGYYASYVSALLGGNTMAEFQRETLLATAAVREMTGAQKQQIQETQTAGTKQKQTLGMLKEALADYKAELERTEIGSVRFNELSALIVSTENKVKSITGSFKELNNEIAKGIKVQGGITLADVEPGLAPKETAPTPLYQVSQAVFGIRRQAEYAAGSWEHYTEAQAQAIRTGNNWITQSQRAEQQMQQFALIGQKLGNIFAASFEAALVSGEDFFTTLGKALKAYLQQLAATVAATAALAVVSSAFGGTTFLTAFAGVGQGTGLAGFFGGSEEFVGRVKGFELLLQQNRTSRNSSLLTGGN